MTQVPSQICPYCGASDVTGRSCGVCGGLQDPESRQATASEIGPWYKRDPQRPFFMGCSFARMAWMIRTGHVDRRSIIRGPTTDGFWMQADRVPGIAHLFGVCHSCGERVHPKQKICAACQSPLFVPAKVGGDPPIIPVTDQPAPADSDSATDSINLVSRAQSRRIERLQNTVRLQIILLALAISLLAACLFIILFFRTGQTFQPSPTTDRASVSTERPDSDRTFSDASDLSVPLPADREAGYGIDPPSQQVPVAAFPDPSPGPGPGSKPAFEYGDQTLEEILQVMRDVTPVQAVLLRKLRVQLDRAEDPDSSVRRRRLAVERARELIEEALQTEQDEFFQARLVVLKGEFEKVGDALPPEPVDPS
ncbi:MAG: hypothetical protein VX641_01205 [Planctomycetota bacterium]|nr:hypothetical protein [Planctomycetota bacterium]